MKSPRAEALHRETVSLHGPVLHADLVVPAQAQGLVLFAHGSGSSRLSKRNRWVAEVLQRHGLATLLFDLLTEDEAQDRRKACNIALQARRVEEAIDWAEPRADLANLPLGILGASTGAAAALLAATQKPAKVRAVVSRGGRADLAMDSLPQVLAPTLLIMGGQDMEMLAATRDAMRRMGCTKRLEVVPGGDHQFEEPGALESVAALAVAWFDRFLRVPGRS